MVSFSCEVCNDTVIKKKLDQHVGRCYGAYFSCIDCSTTFSGTDYRNHTACISEAEKYEKALYKGKKQNDKKEKRVEPAKEKKQEKIEKQEDKKEEKKEAKRGKKAEKETKFNLSKYAASELNLYKIVKKASKDNSKDIKDILKNLSIVINDEGKLIIN